MKYLSSILLCLMVIMPRIGMAETIRDETLKDYYDKGKEAYNEKKWFIALENFIVYQELNKINTLGNSSWQPQDVTKFIQFSKNKISESAKCSERPVWKVMKKQQADQLNTIPRYD